MVLVQDGACDGHEKNGPSETSASGLGSPRSLIRADQAAAPEPQDFAPKETDEGHVLDQGAYQAIEMDTVFESLDTTELGLGRCALQCGLTSPSTEPDVIRARQEALIELDESPRLRECLQALVSACAPNEPLLYDLVWADFSGLLSPDSNHPRPRKGFGYEAFSQSRKLFDQLYAMGGEAPPDSDGFFISKLVSDIRRLSVLRLQAVVKNRPPIRSAFLRGLIGDFRNLSQSRFYQLVTAGIVTESGPRTRGEKPWYVPGYRFRPTFFKPVLLLVALGLLWMGAALYTSLYVGRVGTTTPFVAMMIFYAILPFLFALYVIVVGGAERDNFIKPVGRALLGDPIALKALDALGEIDVLLALLRYRERFPAPMCMPDILDKAQHCLTLKGVRNPVITMAKQDYVENDVDLRKARLSFITGPNSGGKTALCKTILQCQVLAQLGSYVPATEATFTPADRIFYQVPQPGHLDRHEGRFATELSRTRDIFFACGPMSLAVLDEPFEGTSFKERFSVSRQVLDGFIRLASSTLFITHNHELAKSYRKEASKRAQFHMTEFKGDHPTYNFRTGIASHSHAEYVAKEIGFSKGDIEARFEG